MWTTSSLLPSGLSASLDPCQWRIPWRVCMHCCLPTSDKTCSCVCRWPPSTMSSWAHNPWWNSLNPSRVTKVTCSLWLTTPPAAVTLCLPNLTVFLKSQAGSSTHCLGYWSVAEDSRYIVCVLQPFWCLQKKKLVGIGVGRLRIPLCPPTLCGSERLFVTQSTTEFT